MQTHYLTKNHHEVLQLLKACPFLSKSDMIDRLADKDIVVSERTLSRYFATITADFGIDICYSRQHKGYYIEQAESTENKALFRFLDMMTLSQVMGQELQQKSDFKYVSFQSSQHFSGIANFEILIKAVNTQHLLRFRHRNYAKNTVKEHVLSPLLLKEYENRWYLIGVLLLNSKADPELRVFGLDRMDGVELLEKTTLQSSSYQQQLKSFDHIIGVGKGSLEHFKVEKVELLVNDLQKKYLESLPLHASQVITAAGEKGFKVTLHVFINHELRSHILKMGTMVEVLSPLYLRDEFRSLYKEILSKY
jgi:predicted DNA-binding transcriptional regulator YafY